MCVVEKKPTFTFCHYFYSSIVVRTFFVILMSYLMATGVFIRKENQIKLTDSGKYIVQPFEDIEVVYNEDCPSGTTQLELGYWGGIREGRMEGDEEYVDENGNHGMLYLGVPEIPRKYFYDWRGIKICVKEMTDQTLEDFIKNEIKDKSCGKDKRMCGKIEQNGKLFCLEKEKPCPLNYFEITSEENSKYEDEYPDIKTVSFTTSNGEVKYIHYGNGINDLPIIVDFQIAEYEVCKNKTNYYFFTSAYEFDERQMCEKFDLTYERIDSVNHYTFFQEQGMENEIRRLPKYPINSTTDNKIHLFKGLFNKTRYESSLYTLEKKLKNPKIIWFTNYIWLIVSLGVSFVFIATVRIGCKFSSNIHPIYPLFEIISSIFFITISVLIKIVEKRQDMNARMKNDLNKSFAYYICLALTPVFEIIVLYIFISMLQSCCKVKEPESYNYDPPPTSSYFEKKKLLEQKKEEVVAIMVHLFVLENSLQSTSSDDDESTRREIATLKKQMEVLEIEIKELEKIVS